MVRDIHGEVHNLAAKVDNVTEFKNAYKGSPLSDGAAVQRLVDKVDDCGTEIKLLKKDVFRYGCPSKTGGEMPADCIKYETH